MRAPSVLLVAVDNGWARMNVGALLPECLAPAVVEGGSSGSGGATIVG